MTATHASVPLSADPEPTPRWATLRARSRTHLWPIGALYSALAVVAVMSNSWGSYIGDNRFEQYVNPARRLAKSFGVWDPTRGLGAPREDMWPGTTIPGAVIRGLGLAPWIGERFFHALCLVTMALGVTALLKLFRPRIGVEHLVAGLFAGFGPYSAAFLVPTNLYYMMALGPWLVVAMVRGVTEDRPWRWAAIFALLVAWAGNPDPPGLIYNAIILVIAAVYLVHVERATRWRDLAKWAAAMGTLALLCSAWALVKTYAARDMLNARLVDTELPSVSALTSSWSESMRGLGNWLSYFRSGAGRSKPQGVPYFVDWWVVLATFVAPLVALVALWRVHWRAKVLFASMAIISAAVVVSGFASPTASPLGGAILWAMENVTLLSSFRNTYKAGGGLAIGVGVLAGVGVAAAIEAVRDRGSFVRRLPAIATTVVLLAVSFPFWTGSLYHPFQRVAGVPSYWSDAFDYLDHLPDPGLTAVVPAVTRASYRWGWVGDDIFDALLTRPHAVSTGVPLSSPLGANALEAFTLAAQAVPYRTGVVGAIARRLGITEIIVRNDLTWESESLPRPSVYDGLRADPDFERVATFGEVGVGVVAFKDHSNAAIRERLLPPVEVYRVRQPGSLLRAVAGAHGVMLAGDAMSWPNLGTSGLVDAATPLTVSGAVPDDEIGGAVLRSAGVVITDTARRRLRTLVDYEPVYSFTLGPDQGAGRVVRDLYPENTSALSSVWYPDAAEIAPIGSPLSQIPPAFRPANAFDADPATSWGVNWALSPDTPGVRVVLRRPTTVSHVDLRSVLSADGVPSVRKVSLTLSDGTRHEALVDADGAGTMSFAPIATTSLTFRLDSIDTKQGFVGLTDVTVDHLDLREFVQTPTDLFGGRATGPDLGPTMSRTPTAYAFTRSLRTTYLTEARTASGRFDEDQLIRRRFVVARSGSYEASGFLRLSSITSPDHIDEWIHQTTSATATASDPVPGQGQPIFAVDGSLETAWIAPRPLGETLTVRFPRQAVRRVVVTMQSDGAAVGASLVSGTIGGTTVSMSTVADDSCPPFLLSEIAAQGDVKPSATPCYRRAVFELSTPEVTDHVDLRLQGYDKRVNRFGIKWFVNEVDVTGGGHPATSNKIDRSVAVGGTCTDAGLTVGAQDPRPVPVTFHTTVGDLLDGDSVPFTACAPIALSKGPSFLDSGAHGWFDSVILQTPDWPTATVSNDAVPLRFESSDRADATVSLDASSTVVFGQSFDPLWELTVDGGAPAAATAVNGLNGWQVPSGDHELVLRYRPERMLSIAIVISLVGVGCCALLVFGPRRRSVGAGNESVDLSGWELHTPSRRASIAAVVAATVIGATLVGPWALIVGAAVLAVVLVYDDPVLITGSAAPLLFVLAALSSSATLFTGHRQLELTYAKDRVLAHQLTLVAMVFAAQTVALLAVAARVQHSAARRSSWSLRQQLRSWCGASVRNWRAVAVGAVVVVVRLVSFPWSKDAGGVDGLIRNIRLGTSYSTSPVAGAPAVDLPPFAPVLRALVRLSPAVLGAGVLLATCVVVVRWSARRAPGLPMWLVLLAVAVSPLAWGVGLSSQLAALGVLAGLSLLDREAIGLARASAAGVLLGAAVLARPDAVVVVLLAVVILVRREARREAAVVGLVAALVAASWVTFCWSAGTAPWLASTARAMVLDAAVAGPGHVVTWWVAVVGLVAALQSAAWAVDRPSARSR